MALDTPIALRTAAFACAAETTTGTPVSLDASKGSYIVYDLELNDTTEYIPRDAIGGGRYAGITGAKSGKASFKFELCGSGGSGLPSWQDTILASCGFVAAGATSTQSTAANTTITIGHWIGGYKKILAGAMGSFTWPIRAGRPVTGEYEYIGVFRDPVAEAKITPTFPSVQPPAVREITFTLGSQTYIVPEINIKSGGNPFLRNSVADFGGVRSAWIADPKPTVEMSPEALAIGTKNWFAAYDAGTEMSMNIVIGTAGNEITISASRLQLSAPVTEEDRDKLLAHKLTFDVNDLLTVTFG